MKIWDSIFELRAQKIGNLRLKYFPKYVNHVQNILETGNDGWGGILLSQIKSDEFRKDINTLTNVIGNLKYQNIFLSHKYDTDYFGRYSLINFSKTKETAYIHLHVSDEGTTVEEAIGFFTASCAYAVKYGNNSFSNIRNHLSDASFYLAGRQASYLSTLANTKYSLSDSEKKCLWFIDSAIDRNIEYSSQKICDLVYLGTILCVQTQMQNKEAQMMRVYY